MSFSCQSLLSRLSLTQKIVLQVGYGFVAVAATTLNAVVVGIFLKEDSLRTFSNALLISLSISDLLVGIVVAPLTVFQLSEPPQSHSCIVNKVASVVVAVVVVTASTIVAISCDRYYNVTKDANYGNFMTSCRRILLLSVPWLSAIILIFVRVADERVVTWAMVIIFVIFYSLLIGSYLLLIRFLGERQTKISRYDYDSTNIHTKAAIYRQNKKATKFILFIVAAFIACTTCSFIYRILFSVNLCMKDGFDVFKTSGHLMYAVGQFFVQLNSFLNPFLYFAKHPQFKKVLPKLYRKRVCSRKN